LSAAHRRNHSDTIPTLSHGSEVDGDSLFLVIAESRRVGPVAATVFLRQIGLFGLPTPFFGLGECAGRFRRQVAFLFFSHLLLSPVLTLV